MTPTIFNKIPCAMNFCFESLSITRQQVDKQIRKRSPLLRPLSLPDNCHGVDTLCDIYHSSPRFLLIMESRRLSIISSHICPTPSASRQIPTSISNFCSSSQDQASSRDVTYQHQPRNCIFCKIVRGESSAHKLYEDDMCLCILDTKPLSYGHSLIIPKSHFCSMETTPPSVVAAMCSKVPFIGNAIMKATGCDSFNLVVNNGAAAGQVIFHTHMHIIPRKRHDGLWSTESLRRRSLNFDDEASQFVDHVREELSIIFEVNEDRESNLSLKG